MEGFHSENRCQGSPLTDSVAIKEEIDIKDEPEFVIVQSPITEFHEIEKEDHLNYSQSVERESETINSEDYDIACGPCKPEIVKLEPCESVLFVSCEVCKKLFSTETDLREHQNDSVDCIALVDEECKPETISPQGEDMKSAFSLENVTGDEGLSAQGAKIETEHSIPVFIIEKSQLSSHEKNEHKAEVFGCKMCLRTFPRQSLLQRHCDHFISKYTCKICSKSFYRMFPLKRHVHTHTSLLDHDYLPKQMKWVLDKRNRRAKVVTYINRQLADISKPRFKFKPAVKKSHLLDHNYHHQPGKLLSCKNCERSFNRKALLFEHLNDPGTPCRTLFLESPDSF